MELEFKDEKFTPHHSFEISNVVMDIVITEYFERTKHLDEYVEFDIYNCEILRKDGSTLEVTEEELQSILDAVDWYHLEKKSLNLYLLSGN